MYDFTVVVSGAIGLLPTAPDVWVINYHTIRANTSARQATVERYRNQTVKRLVFLDHRIPYGLVEWMRRHNVQADMVSILSRAERELALRRAGYTNPKTPSSGLMALAFAFLSGASSAVMAGFSTDTGHFYDATAVRNHVKEDQQLFALLKKTHGDRLTGGFGVTF